ncbi:RlpA-like double-psi beta-barrel-protein domain-containing protein-containing protein [Schizophyllum commune]
MMFTKALFTIFSFALVATALPTSDMEGEVAVNNSTLVDTDNLHELATAAIKGKATFYDPNGGYGACGKKLNNNDMIVALSSDRYQNGAHCHKKLWVRYNGKKIAVTVEDLCPGCQKSSLDLSRGAFSKIANLDLGIIDVEWWFD